MNTGLCVLLAGLAVGSLGFEAAPKRERSPARTKVVRRQAPPPPAPPPPADTARSGGVSIGPFEYRPMSGEPGGFVPDRRPVVHIPTWVGDNSNDLRLARWWHTDRDERGSAGQALSARGNGIPDAMDNLIRRMEIMYDRGFRRFSLKLPAGDPEIDRVSGRKMSSAQWWTMDATRRGLFERHLAKWIHDKEVAGDPVEVGIYMGYHPSDPHDLRMTQVDLFDTAFEALDPERPEDAERLTSMMTRYRDNIQPWIDIGVSEFWFDNTSPDATWSAFLRLSNNPDYNQHAKFHGEAVPVTWGPCTFNPIESAVRRAAWVETFKVAEYRHSQTIFDPALTEIHLWMSGHHGRHCGAPDSTARGWNFEDLERYFNNGWVLDPEFVFGAIDVWTKGYRRANFEYYSHDSNGKIVRNDGGGSAFLAGVEPVQRIYDMGFISCIADFNGDGRIEVEPIGAPLGRDTDLRMFDERWNDARSDGSTRHRFVDGDVNNDGVIDNEDYAFFMRAVEHYRDFREDPANASMLYTPPEFAMIDLGTAD